MFVFLTAFFLVVVPIYWFVSHEVIGTFALLLTLAFCGMLAIYFSIQSRQDRPAARGSQGRRDHRRRRRARLLPRPRSIWPFWSALTVTIMALGPVFGWWITILGGAMGVWAVTGWCYQYYRDDYQH